MYTYVSMKLSDGAGPCRCLHVLVYCSNTAASEHVLEYNDQHNSSTASVLHALHMAGERGAWKPRFLLSNFNRCNYVCQQTVTFKYGNGQLKVHGFMLSSSR